MQQVAEFFGTEGDAPVDHRVSWMYPADGSTLTIDVCHVRAVDDIRTRFDFRAHEWVAEMEETPFFASNLTPSTGIWVEVARWSGNAPQSTSPGPGMNRVEMGR